MKPDKSDNLAPLADEFGELWAQIAELKEREQELLDQILDVGDDCIRGECFTVGIRRDPVTGLGVVRFETELPPRAAEAA